MRGGKQAKREIALASEAGADMVELRIDGLTDSDQIAALLEDNLLPVIVTRRPPSSSEECFVSNRALRPGRHAPVPGR